MAYNAADEAASEAYARQLQAQEAGFAFIDQRSPLMVNNNQIGQQPNVINARWEARANEGSGRSDGKLMGLCLCLCLCLWCG